MRFVWAVGDSAVIPELKLLQRNIPACRFVPGMLCQERDILELSRKRILGEKGMGWSGEGIKIYFFPERRNQCSAFLALPQELENNPDSILCVYPGLNGCSVCSTAYSPVRSRSALCSLTANPNTRTSQEPAWCHGTSPPRPNIHSVK
ncbi:hypothetical protein QQF64_013674 [Cirrhinus molitorella]|uniref:Uncharacterized protein n=1 Tax=Cirrhinus molitorella TaxID=172907 RepID=A0ABR3LRX4_9TELE